MESPMIYLHTLLGLVQIVFKFNLYIYTALSLYSNSNFVPKEAGSAKSYLYSATIKIMIFLTVSFSDSISNVWDGVVQCRVFFRLLPDSTPLLRVKVWSSLTLEVGRKLWHVSHRHIHPPRVWEVATTALGFHIKVNSNEFWPILFFQKATHWPFLKKGTIVQSMAAQCTPVKRMTHLLKYTVFASI